MTNPIAGKVIRLMEGKMSADQMKVNEPAQRMMNVEPSTCPIDIECLNEYVLIKVFNYLNIEDKLTCTRVCKRWQRILNSIICQPKRLSLTVDSDVPIKELNNLNCAHFSSDTNELITDNHALKLVAYFDQELLNNELFANLNLLIINLIFIEYSPTLDFSQLTSLRHLEIHGDYYEFARRTVYASVEHLFVEKFKPNLFEHFPNLQCLALNQLKIDQNNESDTTGDSPVSGLPGTACTPSACTACPASGAPIVGQAAAPPVQQTSSCLSLSKLKVNYVPVQHSNYPNDLMQLLSSLAPNLEQLHMCLSLCDNDDDLASYSDLEMEINSSKLSTLSNPDNHDLNAGGTNDPTAQDPGEDPGEEPHSKGDSGRSNATTSPGNPVNGNSLNAGASSSSSSAPANLSQNNCTMDKMTGLIRKLRKLKLVEIEFDLEHMTNLSSMNGFLVNIAHELSQLKLKLNTHLKFAKSLDLNSTDRFEFSNFLKTNYRNEQNEIIINGRRFQAKELSSLLRYYHLINVEELYITSKELKLFDRPAVYGYLKQVNALCFECNPGLRLNEILNRLTNVKYVYFNCPSIGQEQINQIPILKPDLEYLAIEEFGEHLDLEFATKFVCLRSLYLGRLGGLAAGQLINLIAHSNNLTYLNVECRPLGKSLEHVVRLYASNAQRSSNFYHLSLSLANYQPQSFDQLDNLVKQSKAPNLKITFYNHA